jgi:hypothetical protein
MAFQNMRDSISGIDKRLAELDKSIAKRGIHRSEARESAWEYLRLHDVRTILYWLQNELQGWNGSVANYDGERRAITISLQCSRRQAYDKIFPVMGAMAVGKSISMSETDRITFTRLVGDREMHISIELKG